MYDDIEYDYLAPANSADRAVLAPARPVDGQLDLADELAVVEGTPKARSSDPPTSHAAAAAVTIKATSAKAKLLLVHYDDHLKWGADAGWTDEEAAGKAGLSLTSEYATRCSELRKLDPPLLAETGKEREGSAGVGRMVSRITPAGIAYVTERGWR